MSYWCPVACGCKGGPDADLHCPLSCPANATRSMSFEDSAIFQSQKFMDHSNHSRK